jgi:phosphopantetheinyl transferase (holo-ACP synthase)
MSSCFTPLEWQVIHSRSGEHAQLCQFYTFWTLKESFVKAIGTGLGFDLQRVQFTYTSSPSSSLPPLQTSSSSKATTTEKKAITPPTTLLSSTSTSSTLYQRTIASTTGPPPSSINGLFNDIQLNILPAAVASASTSIEDRSVSMTPPMKAEPSIWPTFRFKCCALDNAHIAAICVQGIS